MKKPKDSGDTGENGGLTSKNDLRKSTIKNTVLNQAEAQKLIQELEVHQIELRLQNEELLQATKIAQEAKDKYTELYDFAPSGYFSLNEKGEILQLNHSAAKMLGSERSNLINKSFLLFVSNNYKPIFSHFLEESFRSRVQENCEIAMSINDHQPVYVLLTTIVLEDSKQCHITAVDISERKMLEEKLEQSRILLTETERTGKIGGWVFDVETLTQTWTDEVFHILEIDITQGTPKVPEGVGFINPEFRPLAEKGIQRAIEYGESYDQEWMVTTAKGNKRWVHAVGNAHQKNGKTDKISGYFQDISERKFLRKKLDQSQQIIEGILDAIPVRVFWKDLDLVFMGCNMSLAKDAGFSDPKEIIGKTDYQLGWSRMADLYRNDDMQVINSGKGKFNIEESLTTADGKTMTILTNKVVLKNPSGNICGVLGAFMDITELKNAEAKVSEKDLQFRKLSANVPDLIFQFSRRPDGSYCVPIASEGIKNIFGCTPEDVSDNFDAIAEVLHPDDAERVIDDIEYSAKHLTYFTCEFRVNIPGRPVQWIFSRSTPEKLPDGTITWYGFNVNITERKNAEGELIKAKEKAEESDRLKSAFLANMSHEIRTPMNGILGFAALLKEPDLSGEQQKKYISIIEKSGDRMLNIINDIIDISKIESGIVELSLNLININEQLGSLYRYFKPEAEKKGIRLTITNLLPAKDALVETDAQKFSAILTNLIKNAIKYTHQGSIEFGYSAVQNSESLLQFYVKDTGIGIANDRQQAIFERFVQADIEDKKAMQGAGLGLTISKAYTKMLGGSIRVESEEGKGSTFYFTIADSSLAINNHDKKIHAIENHNPELLSGMPPASLTILIAEDDEASEMLLRLNLKKYCKQILSVSSGTEAVETCRNNPDIDLILMDIRMPLLSGYDATKQIRLFNKNVIIIAQTAHGLTGDREKALAAGCNDYLAKPIKKESLAIVMKKWLKK